MKTLIAGLLAFTALSAPLAAQPQASAPAATPAPAPAAATAPKPNISPAMWVVRDEDTTIYMFGTFHALDGRSEWFNDEVLEAFQQSGELVLEVNMGTDPAEMQALLAPLIQRLAIDPEGRRLSSALTTEENAKLYQLLAPMGVPAGAFEPMEPWFVSLTLMNIVAAKMNLDPANGPEMILTNAARTRGMTLGALETAESQFAIFDTTPRESQIDGLKKTLADPEAGLRVLQPMLAAWSSGDAERLAALTAESMAEDPDSYDRLLTARNANWARWIDERMERPGTVFMAVGAGHLVGRGSVQEQLQTLGHSSARVPAR